jgi:hypothetical protein
MNTNEISLNEANDLQNKLTETNQFFMPKSWVIQSSTLAELLGINPDLISNLNGIRIYPGIVEATNMDSQNPNTPVHTLSFICVASDANGNDIIADVPPTQSNGSGIFDHFSLCPESCPNTNAISSNSFVISLTK